MGLALLADRVQALGGQVAIASEPGRGTKVTIDIP
jgi:signal transduction histidine kinase